jgi:hypothetical protein
MLKEGDVSYLTRDKVNVLEPQDTTPAVLAGAETLR